jgi:hypothetical protein
MIGFARRQEVLFVPECSWWVSWQKCEPGEPRKCNEFSTGSRIESCQLIIESDGCRSRGLKRCEQSLTEPQSSFPSNDISLNTYLRRYSKSDTTVCWTRGNSGLPSIHDLLLKLQKSKGSPRKSVWLLCLPLSPSKGSLHVIWVPHDAFRQALVLIVAMLLELYLKEEQILFWSHWNSIVFVITWIVGEQLCTKSGMWPTIWWLYCSLNGIWDECCSGLVDSIKHVLHLLSIHCKNADEAETSGSQVPSTNLQVI